MQRRSPRGGCWCNGRWYKGGQFLPKPKPQPRHLADVTGDLAEALIQATIAYELPPDPTAARALRRVIRGSTAQHDVEVLDRRRRQAIGMLVDRGPDVLRPYWRGVLAAMPQK